MPSVNKPLAISVTKIGGGVVFDETAITPTDVRIIERLSQPYQMDVTFETAKLLDLAFGDVLGNEVVVTLHRDEGKVRVFRGICNGLSLSGVDDRSAYFTATVVPPFWFLSRKVRSRVFEHRTVPSIVEEVLADQPGLDMVNQLTRTDYPVHDYCVQYHESDFNFLSRIMEEEGIYYFFDHTPAGVMMVLADASVASVHAPIDADVKCGPGRSVGFSGTDPDRVYEWVKGQQLRSTKFVLRDYHFEFNNPISESPAAVAASVAIGAVTHPMTAAALGELEIDDYPGEYAHRFDAVDSSGGDDAGGTTGLSKDNARVAQIRMQQEAVAGVMVRGSGSCPAFCPGFRFALTDHFNGNGPYLLVAVTHAISQGGFRAGGGDFSYHNGFSAIPFDTTFPFRPARSTGRPFIPATQTATVVGLDPKGEDHQEIFTDKYGRVKVQFHWDRLGKKDPKSSCWVRVATQMAGQGWGTVYTPRVGQEVIVSFLEGNPDQPIVVGCVYNFNHMPPWALPDNRTKSGIRTRSSPDGKAANFNELRFEDRKGAEEVYFHAEKDFVRVVENDDTLKVGYEKHDKGSQHVFIHNNQQVVVGDPNGDGVKPTLGSRLLKVWNNNFITVGVGKTDCAEGDEGHEIWNNHRQVIGTGEGQNPDGSQSVTIWKDRTVELKTGNDSLAVDKGARTVTIAGDDTLAVDKGNRAVTLKQGDDKLSIKMGNQTVKLDLGSSTTEAMQSITLKVGQNSIVIDQTGVTIKGLSVKVEGQIQAQVKGLMTNVSADAMLQMKGAITMIG